MIRQEFLDLFRLQPGKKVRLKDHDTGWAQTKELKEFGKDAVNGYPQPRMSRWECVGSRKTWDFSSQSCRPPFILLSTWAPTYRDHEAAAQSPSRRASPKTGRRR